MQVVEGGEVGLTSVVRGSSVLTVSGGELLNVSPGESFDGDTIAAWDNSTVNITGGRIGVSTDEEDFHAVHANDSSTVNISGGEVFGEGEGAVAVNDSAVINISAGHIYDMGDPAVKAFFGGTVNVSGGRLGFADDFEPWPFPVPFLSRRERMPGGIYVRLKQCRMMKPQFRKSNSRRDSLPC